MFTYYYRCMNKYHLPLGIVELLNNLTTTINLRISLKEFENLDFDCHGVIHRECKKKKHICDTEFEININTNEKTGKERKTLTLKKNGIECSLSFVHPSNIDNIYIYSDCTKEIFKSRWKTEIYKMHDNIIRLFSYIDYSSDCESIYSHIANYENGIPCNKQCKIDRDKRMKMIKKNIYYNKRSVNLLN